MSLYNLTKDEELILNHSDNTVGSSVAGKDENGDAQVLDLGANVTVTNMDACFVVSAFPTVAADTLIKCHMQVSSTSAFTTPKYVATVELGDALVVDGGADLSTGVYKLPFSNMIGGTLYRYARCYFEVSGTIDTDMTVDAFLTPHRP